MISEYLSRGWTLPFLLTVLRPAEQIAQDIWWEGPRQPPECLNGSIFRPCAWGRRNGQWAGQDFAWKFCLLGRSPRWSALSRQLVEWAHWSVDLAISAPSHQQQLVGDLYEQLKPIGTWQWCYSVWPADLYLASKVWSSLPSASCWLQARGWRQIRLSEFSVARQTALRRPRYRSQYEIGCCSKPGPTTLKSSRFLLMSPKRAPMGLSSWRRTS